ncbi:MAG: sigma-70 family RNA polymerase sigma factor [Candidatus Anammoximicrobium sp.]|nr:sigma-70 family RNA polymerase sigma factor [Candidatus Anammoximicrobium sp.]
MATERTAGGEGLTPKGTPSPLDIGTLVVDHHRDVYRYAYRLAGRQDDAEDLTQQTFLIAQQRLHQVRQPERVRSWLFAILRTCYLKSERKSVPLPATGIELDVDSIPDGAADQPIDEELLQSVIDELPDEFKLVLVMFYFEECSYKEIAEKLQIPIGTVMSRLTRAKGRVRARLLEADVQADTVSKLKTVRQRAVKS